jgi:acetolactate synthase-1/2/3 large subunit
MNGAQYIAGRLAREGIKKAFLVQGAANNDLIYAIADQEGIDYVCAQHEQAAGFMAEGYAKVAQVPGLCIATSGPGGQNLITPIANCFYDSVACIFITGQVNSRFIRPNEDLRQVGFQEWPIVDCVRSITKYAAQVLDPSDIPAELEKAIFISTAGRPGPVLLDIPIDVQRAEVDERNAPGFMYADIRTMYLPTNNAQLAMTDKIARLVQDLTEAERPVLLIGGGCQERRTRRALASLVESLNIPIFPTWNALDVVTSDFKNYGGRIGTYGGAGRNFAIQNADLLIAVGCRISGRITGGAPSSFARRAKRYYVDVDQDLLIIKNQQQPAHVNVWADAETFMDSLNRDWRNYLAENDQPDWTAWREQVQRWRYIYDPIHDAQPVEEGIHPYFFARVLSELLPSDAIVVTDCGGNVVTMNHAFETRQGQRFISNNGNSPMGFSFCGAMGAWFADPSRPVICVIGDGGFQLNIQELQTMVNYGVNVKTFILDNGVYGITKAYQETNMNGRYEASSEPHYTRPVFQKVVKAYGITPDYISGMPLREKLINTLRHDGPIVCVVDCPNYHTYQPRITGWDTPIEDMHPYIPIEEYQANMGGRMTETEYTTALNRREKR